MGALHILYEACSNQNLAFYDDSAAVLYAVVSGNCVLMLLGGAFVAVVSDQFVRLLMVERQ